MRTSILAILSFVLFSSCASVKFPAFNEITASDLEKNYVPSGPQYDKLDQNAVVYYHTNLEANFQDPIEQIGVVTVKTQYKYFRHKEDPDLNDYYAVLKDFARSKGANVIILLERKNQSDSQAVGSIRTNQAVFKLAKNMKK